jgi:uncharacterized protein
MCCSGSCVGGHKCQGLDKKEGLTARPWQVLVFLLLLTLLAIPAIGAYTAYSLAKIDRRLPEQTPANYGLTYTDVTFPSRVDNLNLHGWYLPAQPQEAARSVVLLHGQHGHRADEFVGLLPLAARLVERGYNVLTFDMRGHGESEGSYRSFGDLERRDLAGALDFLQGLGTPGQWVGVIGFSMGAGTALLTAAEDERIQAVVADSSYAAIRELVEEELPEASRLPAFFTPIILAVGQIALGIDLDAVRPEEAIGQIAPRPVLLVHGTADDIVPPDHANRLAAAMPQATLWTVPSVGHAQAMNSQPDEYLRRIEATFAGALP